MQFCKLFAAYAIMYCLKTEELEKISRENLESRIPPSIDASILTNVQIIDTVDHVANWDTVSRSGEDIIYEGVRVAMDNAIIAN